jgi:3'-phosphoadenosine 5'-phosphosulfate sulfotransferase (PAPS reductase)/FAD synthetase
MRLDLNELESAFGRHRNIAFQFSGGRDSTAALYLLRPLWNRMTVYHLDTGDQFPETREVVAQVERDVPIVRIYSDVRAVREQFGMPSDLVPVDNTDIGRMVSGRQVKLQGRYDCCARSLMAPIHQRMIADGITLIVRGQRDDEYAAPPHRSGDSGGGFEVLYPIQSWTGDEVSAYLKDKGLPLAQFYERGAKRAPECMGCTAWWDEGRAAYMREYHPQAFEAYRANMKIIRIEIDRQYAMLDD